MTRVFKYAIEHGRTTIGMPEGSTVVHVAMQDKHVTLWAEVTDGGQPELREFLIVGTGQTIPDRVPFQHVGTVMDGPFVWHVYEILKS